MKYLKARTKPLEIRATTTADFTTCSIPLITTANSGDQKAADKKALSLPPRAPTSNANRTAAFTYMFVHTSECKRGTMCMQDIAEDYLI
jgi:hypothetical protein